MLEATRVHDGAVSRDLGTLLAHNLAQEGFKNLESPANLLFGDVCQLVDLAERAGDLVLAASNEDAACDDGLLGFSLEDLALVGFLEEQLGGLGNDLGDV